MVFVLTGERLRRSSSSLAPLFEKQTKEAIVMHCNSVKSDKSLYERNHAILCTEDTQTLPEDI